jgi:phosphoenolpyruvate carboxylase
VRRLGTLLGETLVRQEGEDLYRRVERVRACAKDAAAPPGVRRTFHDLAEELASMPLDAAVPVARAFSQFLHWRTSRRAPPGAAPARRTSSIRSPGPSPVARGHPAAPGAAASPARLREAVLGCDRAGDDGPPDRDDAATLQRKYNAIAGCARRLDRRGATPLERQALIDTLRREITAAWETEEMRRDRPSPLDEVRSALAVFEHTIWDAVPEYLRSLDRTLVAVTGSGLPLDAAPIRFGSWIGGDRDGNPSITPEVTRRACLSRGGSR